MHFIEDNLLLPSLLCGVIFIITGFIMLKFPPKKINMLYGYRTNRSMKNQENWDFAQKYSAKLLMRSGLFLVLLSGLSLIFPFSNKLKLIVSLALVIGSIIILLIKTETELKKRFP